MTIDEEGQARTTDWKFRIAKRIYELATERYGLEPTDLIFDCLTFPLSTGQDDLRRDAIETMEAIKRVKAELPGVSTILGVSNVSFGLKAAARHVLNSVFLHECVQVGLDAAIVHAARIMPMHKIDQRIQDVTLDLVYDRRRDDYDPLTEFMALFEGVEAGAVEKEDRSGWPVEERLKHRIIDGDRDGIEADLDESLTTRPALSVINDVLLDGMKVVGDLFVGRHAAALRAPERGDDEDGGRVLEPHMEKADSGGKGRVVIGTVKGDVHDIGKNLVDIILTNNGYEVLNLGIKVPLTEFVDKATELEADAIGMSGLLVKSTIIMRENLEELNDRGLDRIPVLLGGAALDAQLRRARPARGVQGTRLLREGRVRGPSHDGHAHRGQALRAARPGLRASAGGSGAPAAQVPACGRGGHRHPRPLGRRRRRARFEPPFLGARVAKGISIDDIASYLNETALFRNQWQFRPEKQDGRKRGDGGSADRRRTSPSLRGRDGERSETDAEFKDRIRPVLRDQLDRAKAEGLLVPAVAWGYFPVSSDGDDLVVWSDDDRTAERLRFNFPRQQKDRYLCISDFFRSIDSGEKDYAGFHVVTIGNEATERERELFAADKYQDYLLLHGLSVEMAEALAELWHRRIREEWGFADEDGPTLAGLFRQQYRGSRYSWGYPACPDLEDQAKVAELLEIERIGVTLTEEFHLVPEQSTSAIIVPHPEAKYFIA